MVSTEKDDALIERLLRIADKYKSCRLNHFSKPTLHLLSTKAILKKYLSAIGAGVMGIQSGIRLRWLLLFFESTRERIALVQGA